MSDSLDSTATRRRLTDKRADTVRRLSEAAAEVVRESPYSDLTFQQIATRAGVTRATAYVYFSSKEHILAEVYRRRLVDAPPPDLAGLPVADRVAATFRHLALLWAENPEFGRAAARALLVSCLTRSRSERAISPTLTRLATSASSLAAASRRSTATAASLCAR